MDSPLPLQVTVDVSGDLTASHVAVVYHRWGGGLRTHAETNRAFEVARAPLTVGPVVLSVPPPPGPAVSVLPQELGGGFPFAVGYVLAFDDDGVCAVAPTHRVLWLPAPFPASQVREAVDALPGESLDAELSAALELLATFPAGVSLAHRSGSGRSLFGFAPADVSVPLSAATSTAWPPESF